MYSVHTSSHLTIKLIIISPSHISPSQLSPAHISNKFSRKLWKKIFQPQSFFLGHKIEKGLKVVIIAIKSRGLFIWPFILFNSSANFALWSIWHSIPQRSKYFYVVDFLTYFTFFTKIMLIMFFIHLCFIEKFSIFFAIYYFLLVSSELSNSQNK